MILDNTGTALVVVVFAVLANVPDAASCHPVTVEISPGAAVMAPGLYQSDAFIFPEVPDTPERFVIMTG
ncbi:hypothetical protein D3C80_1262970 [compost metagenome]